MARKDKYTAWLQARLNDLGYDIAVDGVNGPQTQAAIKDVQRAFGLKETGTATKEFEAAFKTIQAQGPAQLQGGMAIPSGPVPNVSGRLQMTPPMPNLRPQPQVSASGAMPEPASGSLPAIGPRERMAQALMQSGAIPPPPTAPGPDAGALGPPPGVPLTGPGGSPAPQYPPQNIFSDMLNGGLGNILVPGYDRKMATPMVEPTTGNSPLAGAESYQPQGDPSMPPTRQLPPDPRAMSQGEFAMRFDPNMMNPAQAGMVPNMGMTDPRREMLRRLLMQMQGQ